MNRRSEFLTLIDIKKFGRGNLKDAFKVLVFKSESSYIVRWGTKTKKNFKIGFKCRCSFNVINEFIENNKFVLIVEHLRVIKQ